MKHIDRVADRVPVPAQATANAIAAGAVMASEIDWLSILTISLIVIQIVYWLDRLGRQWGWWGKR